MTKERIKKIYLIGNPDNIVERIEMMNIKKHKGIFKGNGIKVDVIFDPDFATKPSKKA